MIVLCVAFIVLAIQRVCAYLVHCIVYCECALYSTIKVCVLQLSVQIGVDFALKVLNWDNNTTIRLQLWDIAGSPVLVCVVIRCNFHSSCQGYPSHDYALMGSHEFD